MGNGGLECCTQVLDDNEDISSDGEETTHLLDKTIIDEYIERNSKNSPHQPSNSAEANGEMDDLIEKEDDNDNDNDNDSPNDHDHEFIATQEDNSSLSSTLSSDHDEHEEHKHGYIDNNKHKTDGIVDEINLEGTPSLSFPIEDELDKQILALMNKSPEPIQQPPVHIPSEPLFQITSPNLPNHSNLPTDSLEMKKTRSKERKKSKKEQFETLKHELDEAEIRLKQQKRVQQLLKKQNDALRKENSMLKSHQTSDKQKDPPSILDTTSLSPEISPLSPITISITTQHITVHGKPNLNNNGPGGQSIENLTLPPVGRDVYSITEENAYHDGNILGQSHSQTYLD